MYDKEISLQNILISFEGVLKITHTAETQVADTIQLSIDHLEESCNVQFDKDIYSLQRENQLTDDKLSRLLRDVKTCCEQLSFFIMLKTFHKNVPINLADVNYLTTSRKQCLVSFKYLRDVDEYRRHREGIIGPFTNALNNISMCTIKRCMIIMLVLDRLGIYEGAMVMANLLYLGGLVI